MKSAIYALWENFSFRLGCICALMQRVSSRQIYRRVVRVINTFQKRHSSAMLACNSREDDLCIGTPARKTLLRCRRSMRSCKGSKRASDHVSFLKVLQSDRRHMLILKRRGVVPKTRLISSVESHGLDDFDHEI